MRCDTRTDRRSIKVLSSSSEREKVLFEIDTLLEEKESSCENFQTRRKTHSSEREKDRERKREREGEKERERDERKTT